MDRARRARQMQDAASNVANGSEARVAMRRQTNQRSATVEWAIGVHN